jgi:hypothetical protein
MADPGPPTSAPVDHGERAALLATKLAVPPVRPVGVMRRYQRDPDGSWHDGLLLDLLPEDLTEPQREAAR